MILIPTAERNFVQSKYRSSRRINIHDLHIEPNRVSDGLCNRSKNSIRGNEAMTLNRLNDAESRAPRGKALFKNPTRGLRSDRRKLRNLGLITSNANTLRSTRTLYRYFPY